MSLPTNATDYWPTYVNGTSIRNVPRHDYPPPGIRTEHQSVDPPGWLHPSVQNARAPDKVPRNDQPAPKVQGVTRAKREEADALRSSHLPTGSTRDLDPKDPPRPGAQVVTRSERRPVNPPGSSHPPVKFSPVLAPSNVPQQLVEIRPKISL